MAKSFKVEKKGGYSVIEMEAERLDAQSTPELRSELVLQSGASIKNVIIDLKNCHYCDTTGLSAILIAHRLCKEGHLVLAGVAPEVENMLSIQRFDPPLNTAVTLEEAEEKMQSLIGQ